LTRNLQKDHGGYTIWWGHANSPVISGKNVISACMQDPLDDVEGGPVESYLVAHDLKTGRVAWRQTRSTGAHAEEGDAYTTPLLWQRKGRVELVVMGGNQLDGYDPRTGKQLWQLPGLVGGRTVTGPTVAHDMVYATLGMRRDLIAVNVEGTGELSRRSIVWKNNQGTPDSCSPVVWDKWLFFVSDDGIARCFDALTGHLQWKERLKGNYQGLAHCRGRANLLPEHRRALHRGRRHATVR
jgi:outer membrane protein assembly factor BamB